MLVNEHTLSAGEMVAAFATENGLARIVGTRTGGQVLGGGNFSVGHGFVLSDRRDISRRIPNASRRAISPITDASASVWHRMNAIGGNFARVSSR
jgi:hypothetical protein